MELLDKMEANTVHEAVSTLYQSHLNIPQEELHQIYYHNQCLTGIEVCDQSSMATKVIEEYRQESMSHLFSDFHRAPSKSGYFF